MQEHLKLVKENLNFDRRGRQMRLGDREVNVYNHGHKLKENFSNKKKEYEKNIKIGEELVFLITKDTDKELNFEKIGLEFVADIQSKKQVVVKVVDEVLFNKSISDFTANKINVKKPVFYSEFANIEEFDFLTPEEKMSNHLKSVLRNCDNEEITIDIQLYTFEENMASIHKRVIDINSYIKEWEAETISDCLLPHLVLLRISINSNKVYDFLKHNNIFTADTPQTPIYSQEEYETVRYEIKDRIIPPESDSPKITIIDSGILPTHPLLTGAIESSEYFGTFSSPFDENGHGTMVAGIVQYGDVYKSLVDLSENKSLKQNFYLLSARVTNSKNQVPNEDIVTKSVNDAIEYYASSSNGYNSKIFNISLGDPNHPYIPDTKMDPWSYQLDMLNYKYNIAMVVSAGNYSPGNHREKILDNYLNYMLEDSDSTIIPPGVSISSITVGSLAKDDVPHSGARQTITLPVAQKGFPSPFTRTGYGYKKSIKPETVAMGGNYSFDPTTKQLDKNDRNLGILSTSLFDEKSKGWFQTRNGTSFAAPFITHLLGKIKSNFPNAKGNLLRALLLSNSYKSGGTQSLLENSTNRELKPSELNELTHRIEGYGKIREENLISSSDNCVKMYYESKIGMDKVDVFEVPIPSDVYKRKRNTYITVAIAYNPPCRDKRIDYKGVSIDFKLLRGVSQQRAIEYLCKPNNDEFEINKDLAKKYECKMSPSSQTASRGTTIVSRHKITNSRNTNEEDYTNQYYLGIRCQRKWWDGVLPQDYAVVVTIESEDEELDIYNPIKNRIEAKTRTSTRIRT